MVFRSFLWSMVACFVLLLTLAPAMAQEVDYDEAQYTAYTEAVNEPDLAKRVQKIVAFAKAHPDISLVPYALQALGGVVNEYRQNGDWRNVLSSAKALQSFQPEEAALNYVVAEAAFQLQDFKQASTFGEKFYAAQPSPGVAYLLAFSYLQLNNDSSFLQYAKIVADGFQPNTYTAGHYQILAQARNKHAAKEKWEDAAFYSGKVLAGFGQGQVPDGWGSDVLNPEKAVSHALQGRAAYESSNWNRARSEYESVIAITSDRNLRAESHYYVGLCHWKDSRLDPAMEAFAKCSVIRGAPHQDACDKYLIQLYRSTHNDSIAGLEEYRSRVTGN